MPQPPTSTFPFVSSVMYLKCNSFLHCASHNQNVPTACEILDACTVNGKLITSISSRIRKLDTLVNIDNEAQESMNYESVSVCIDS